MKIAFTGTSGAGKTTLVTWLVEELQKYDPEYKHISGSAGDVKTEGDKMIVDEAFKYPGGGHAGVIRYSALNPEYGLMNQKLLQMRRAEIIANNDKFVTDRSPLDNLTYMINQVAYHPMITDAMVIEFASDCLRAYEELTHLIYIKAVQPSEVERNGSRIANSWYQKAIDAQFAYWLDNFFYTQSFNGPEVLVINYWDLDKRKKAIRNFLDLKDNRIQIPFPRDEVGAVYGNTIPPTGSSNEY